MDDIAIRTEALTKRYDGFTAVDRLDLEIRTGEIFGLLGPNGAGKTTTILMLLGLSEPSGGTASVIGLDPTRNPLEIKRRVGYLPDNVGFYPRMTGRENLRYTARLNGLDDAEAEGRIGMLLEQVGLAGPGNDRVETYSRGMRQRLGIADTLVKDPSVVILDEPTIAIDPEGVAEILELIGTMAHDRGVTVLLSSHLLHQVQSICDRVGIFVAGRMVASGPMHELVDRLAPGDLTLEVGTDPSVDEVAVRAALGSVTGVHEVRRDARDPGLWIVAAGEDVRPQAARALLDAGIELRHLRRRGDELDELYRRYFEQEARDAARAG